MPLKNGRLTPQETAFAERYAATGDAHYAAEKAGYSPRSLAKRAHDNLHDPAVMARVKEHIRTRTLARAENMPDTLADIAEDGKQPAGARVTAADKLLSHARAFMTDAASAKDPHEMTPDEVAARLVALRTEAATLANVAADRARPILEHEPGESAEKADIFG